MTTGKSWLTVAALGSSVVCSRVAAAADDELSLDLGDKVTLDLRRVDRGKFTQGSPTTELNREPDETPHSVTLSRAFWIGKVPVTRGQFSRFVSETRHVTDSEKAGGYGFDAKAGMLTKKKDFSWRNPGFAQREEDPVVMVTFGDASAFVAWVSRKTGKRVRLPTEAEWEYAARAGTTTPFYGATKDDEAFALGWFRMNSGGSTHPVGTKKANAFGLFDMAGNVQEWCHDLYAPYPSGEVVDPDVTTLPQGVVDEKRVLRGGSWIKDPKRARSAARSKSAAGARNADVGFRVLVEMDSTQPPSNSPSDFTPATPQPMGSSGLGADASASAVVPPPPRPVSSEGFPWAMLLAPFAGAGFAVAWTLARRKRGHERAHHAMSSIEPSIKSPLAPLARPASALIERSPTPVLPIATTPSPMVSSPSQSPLMVSPPSQSPTVPSPTATASPGPSQPPIEPIEVPLPKLDQPPPISPEELVEITPAPQESAKGPPSSERSLEIARKKAQEDAIVAAFLASAKKHGMPTSERALKGLGTSTAPAPTSEAPKQEATSELTVERAPFPPRSLELPEAPSAKVDAPADSRGVAAKSVPPNPPPTPKSMPPASPSSGKAISPGPRSVPPAAPGSSGKSVPPAAPGSSGKSVPPVAPGSSGKSLPPAAPSSTAKSMPPQASDTKSIPPNAPEPTAKTSTPPGAPVTKSVPPDEPNLTVEPTGAAPEKPGAPSGGET